MRFVRSFFRLLARCIRASWNFLSLRRVDLSLTEGLWLAGFCLVAAGYLPGLWPYAWFPGAIGGVWTVWHFVVPSHFWTRETNKSIPRLLTELAVLAALTAAASLLCHHPLQREEGVLGIWIAVFLIVSRRGLQCAKRRGLGNARENLRWVVLGVISFFLFRAFFTPVQQGGGDARWYGTMMADMLAQVRTGVFPVFTGQSEYQFNGAIYPLRVAPGFHYFGAVLDLATGQCLPAFTVQNLLIASVGIATLFCAYFCLAALLPGRRWLGGLLAILFLACPGVIGVAYNSDLYMSWMTLPFLPLVLYGTLKSFRGAGLGALVMLGAALGCMYWGHSPLALWTTALAALAQLARFAVRPPRRADLAGAAVAAGVFAVIAFYPLASVLFFPIEPGLKLSGLQDASLENILYFIRQVYPLTFHPVSEMARSLSDFQLGWTLWALLGLSALLAFVRLRVEAIALVALAAVVALLLTPAFGIEESLWSHVPDVLRNPTGNWAMNRLYVTLAGTTVFAAAAAWPKSPRRWSGKVLQGAAAVALVAGTAWSLAEANKFVRAGIQLSAGAAHPNAALQTENVTITRFADFAFSKAPGYFNHGVVDPRLENRLLDPVTGKVIASNEAYLQRLVRPETPTGTFTRMAESNLRLALPIRLLPGRRYALVFDFVAPEKAVGVLVVQGKTLLRVYQLPEYGGVKSFGAGGEHSRVLPLWTSNAEPEDVTVIFSPDAAKVNPNELPPFARVALVDYDPNQLPIRVESWIPYRASVDAPRRAWLETPRRYQRHYHAEVNGQPAVMGKSAEALTSVEVPAGRSVVTLAWSAPLGLMLAFWLSASTASLLALAGFAWVLQAQRRLASRPVFSARPLATPARTREEVGTP